MKLLLHYMGLVLGVARPRKGVVAVAVPVPAEAGRCHGSSSEDDHDSVNAGVPAQLSLHLSVPIACATSHSSTSHARTTTGVPASARSTICADSACAPASSGVRLPTPLPAAGSGRPWSLLLCRPARQRHRRQSRAGPARHGRRSSARRKVLHWQPHEPEFSSIAASAACQFGVRTRCLSDDFGNGRVVQRARWRSFSVSIPAPVARSLPSVRRQTGRALRRATARSCGRRSRGCSSSGLPGCAVRR